MQPAYKLAAPSFVWPAGIGENCLSLQQLVQEVGLVFFETAGCLQYTAQDLPPWLASLDLAYHLHLPLDLPWDKGAAHVFDLCCRLMQKTEYLSPSLYVLHPPGSEEQLLEFCRLWARDRSLQTLALENVQGCDLTGFWPRITELGLSICLDLGHMLSYQQHELLQMPGFWQRVRMLHVYGDLDGHRHNSLQQLSTQGRQLLQQALQSIPQEFTLVLEVFDPNSLQTSLDIFRTWISNWDLQQY
ncbi:MAG: cobamide remodeling phosphodiesterase CbiR [Desulfohalobiaceae bacterium]